MSGSTCTSARLSERARTWSRCPAVEAHEYYCSARRRECVAAIVQPPPVDSTSRARSRFVVWCHAQLISCSVGGSPVSVARHPTSATTSPRTSSSSRGRRAPSAERRAQRMGSSPSQPAGRPEKSTLTCYVAAPSAGFEPWDARLRNPIGWVSPGFFVSCLACSAAAAVSLSHLQNHRILCLGWATGSATPRKPLGQFGMPPSRSPRPPRRRDAEGAMLHERPAGGPGAESVPGGG